MKKQKTTKKIISLALAVILLLALVIPVGAKAAGPFEAGAGDNIGSHFDFEDFYENGGLTAFQALLPAIAGKKWLTNPQFIAGSEGFGGENGASVGSPVGNWAWNLFVMSWHKLNADGDMISSKYCGNYGMWGDKGFFVEWKYDQAYIADSFLLATGNDCTAYPRRMADGWTFSGSNDGSSWTVLYTGKGEDYDPITFTWWRFDLPDNTEAFQYYRLFADDYYDDQDIIQLSVVAVTGNLPVSAMVTPAPVAAAPAPAAPLPAPRTIFQTARPTSATVLINGEEAAFDAYNIEGNNYFKMCDLAFVLSGTDKQFNVGWEIDEKGTSLVTLTSGEAYDIVGGEMEPSTTAGSITVTTGAYGIYLDGEWEAFTAYLIGGNNYFKLRDIMEALDVYVGWDGASNTITLDTGMGYES